MHDFSEYLTDYVVSENGQPRVVRAVAWQDILWDPDTRYPIFSPSKFAALSDAERTKVAELLQTMPPESPLSIIRRYKRTACERRSDLNPRVQIELRSFFKKEFYALHKIAAHPAIRECVVRAPSQLPLPYKLAVGQYEFYPRQTRQLASQARMLRETGKYSLYNALRDANLIDRRQYPSITDKKDCPSDPLFIATKLYGIKDTQSLVHMIELWESAEAFFNFVKNRANWKGHRAKTELLHLSTIAVPDKKVRSPQTWRQIFERQMSRQPYTVDTDLMRLYQCIPEVEDFTERSGLKLSNCSSEYLLSMAFTRSYPRADANLRIAQLCAQWHMPNRIFLDALQTMSAVSAEDSVPDVQIDGSKFAMPNYEIVKLKKNDPTILFVGAMVHSCGHIGGSIKKVPMIRATATHHDVGCYVVRHKTTGVIFAKSTVWLSPHEDGTQDLVINAVHSESTLSNKRLEAIATAIAEETQERFSFIANVYMGKHKEELDFPSMRNRKEVMPRDQAIRTSDTDTLFIVRTRKAKHITAVA